MTNPNNPDSGPILGWLVERQNSDAAHIKNLETAIEWALKIIDSTALGHPAFDNLRNTLNQRGRR